MVLCIVQARMGSSRLYGKVIKEIKGKPMILYTLDRLKKSRYIDKLVLATSIKESENELCRIVEGSGYPIFRGSEEDVLERYYLCNKKYQGDAVIRITGDCPLIDPEIVDHATTFYNMNNYEYVRLDVPDSFVRGLDVEVFSSSALEKAYKLADRPEYREHVTLYMYRNPTQFSTARIKGEGIYNRDYRLCVDTEEDFELVKKIYEHFPNENVTAKEAIKYLDSDTRVAYLNKQVRQKEV